MSTLDSQRPTTRLDLPPALASQLRRYRGAVWRTKLAEAVAAAACGILGGERAVFCLDRVGETQPVVRWAAFALAAVAAAQADLGVEQAVLAALAVEVQEELVVPVQEEMDLQILVAALAAGDSQAVSP